MSLRRRMRRARARTIDWDCSVDLELITVSATQLGLTPDESEASFDLFNERPASYEHGTVDVQLARIVQLAEGIGLEQFLDRDVSELRAELEQRRGAGFLIEVAGYGTPASDWIGSHKIHAVNLLARARAAFEDALWRWFCGGWGRGFTGGFRQRSRVGHWSARASSPSEGSAPRSSFGSTRRRTTRTSSSDLEIQSSLLGERAARSNELPVSGRRGPRSASSTVVRTPEEWALYRLRVQNLLLTLPEGGAA